MFIIIVILACVLLLWLYKNNNRISKEMAEARETSGNAEFIRNHFPLVVDYFLSLGNASILFERTNMIKIGVGNDGDYFVIFNSSSRLHISFIRLSTIIKEWRFKFNEDQKHIIYELSKYQY